MTAPGGAGSQGFTGRVPGVGTSVKAGGDWSLYLPDGLGGRACQFFQYELDFLPVTHATSTTGSLQIQNDSDFCCLAVYADIRSTDNQTTLAYPQWPFTLLITDTGAGRNLSNIAVPLANLAAPNQYGQKLVQPNFFAAASTIGVQLTSLAASTDYNIRLTFSGVKVYGFTVSGR